MQPNAITEIARKFAEIIFDKYKDVKITDAIIREITDLIKISDHLYRKKICIELYASFRWKINGPNWELLEIITDLS